MANRNQQPFSVLPLAPANYDPQYNNNLIRQLNNNFNNIKNPGESRVTKQVMTDAPTASVDPTTNQQLEDGTVWNDGGFLKILPQGNPGDVTAASVYAGAYQWAPQSVIIIPNPTTAYTLSAADNGKVLLCLNNVPNVLTITTSAGLGQGFSVTVIQGMNTVQFAAGGGTSLGAAGSYFVMQNQFAVARLFAAEADVFVATGDFVYYNMGIANNLGVGNNLNVTGTTNSANYTGGGMTLTGTIQAANLVATTTVFTNNFSFQSHAVFIDGAGFLKAF